jgi:ribosomal protein L22
VQAKRWPQHRVLAAQAQSGGAVDPRPAREAALATLTFSPKRVAARVKKVLQSAIANAENNHDLDVDDLVVSEASVGKNLVMKRFHARARGRGGRIEKPFAQGDDRGGRNAREPSKRNQARTEAREGKRRQRQSAREKAPARKSKSEGAGLMGQKVNPIGLRLGVNRTWDSRWYASKKEYGKLLQEDIKIRNYLLGQAQAGRRVAHLHRAAAQEVPRDDPFGASGRRDRQERAPTSKS